jgi:uncharacterized protein
MKKSSFLLVVFALFVVFPVSAQERLIPLKPEPAQFVNDYAGVITNEQQAALEQKLKDFDKETSNQFAIAIVKSLKGNNLEKTATQWFKAWGIGQKDKNNGVLILIALEDRKMRVEVGYGLETAISKAEADLVIQNLLKPHFRNQEYYNGLNVATNYLMELARKAYNQPQASAPQNASRTMQAGESANVGDRFYIILLIGGVFVFILMIGIVFYRSWASKRKHKVYTSPTSNTSYASSSSSTHNTYTSYDSSSSSSYDSSSSSSDSSSYGGGDSGGGGSSGDW